MFRSVTGMTIASLVLAAILFVSVNALSDRFLRGAHFDLTDQSLYTLSDGTKAVLAKIDEPITLKFYYSRRLGEVVPAYGVYAQRVRELLEEYAARAKGKIALQILDPLPYSEVEDQATAAGLQGVPVEDGDEQVYFGLAGTNSTDDAQAIPFFQQDREKFLEYDVTRLVQSLAFPKKKVIGLYTKLPLEGDPMAQMQGRPTQALAILDQLRQSVELRDLPMEFAKVPDDVDVLMIVQPEAVSPQTEYAIDQFVLAGGRVLVFADPNSELQQAHPSMLEPQGGPTAAQFDRLLKSWGVELAKGKVVGDRQAARRVEAGGPGRSEPADYLAWLNLKGAALNPDDPVTGKLAQINLATAGALSPIAGARTKFEPLLQSSMQSELIDTSKVQGLPDVAGLLGDFKATGRYVMAARITGPADTAFPDGPPKDDKAKAPPDAAAQLKTAKTPIDIIVVADSDILDDRFWVQAQDFFGQRVVVPTANNADFVQNAVDSLTGAGDLIGLRSRGSSVRPFLRVDEIQRDAEDRYQSREKELQDQLKDTQAKLAGMRSTGGEGGKEQLTPEQQTAIEQFRASIIQTRTELRQVQLALRQDIDRLKTVLVALDVGLVPLGVALVAIMLGIVRARRRQRRVRVT